MLGLAVPAVARHSDLLPATQDAILAGARACVGTTADPQGQAARLVGWIPAPRGSFKTDGQALMRDKVLVSVTPGRDGACVVVARAGPDFRGLRLLADLKKALGATLRSDAPPVLTLPNGEVMRLNIGAKRGGPTYIQLALANPKGK